MNQIDGLDETTGWTRSTEKKIVKIERPDPGPTFAGLGAIFEREMIGSERVAILLDLLGRQTRLVLSSEMIGRI